jgi:hypothetical protein
MTRWSRKGKTSVFRVPSWVEDQEVSSTSTWKNEVRRPDSRRNVEMSMSYAFAHRVVRCRTLLILLLSSLVTATQRMTNSTLADWLKLAEAG